MISLRATTKERKGKYTGKILFRELKCYPSILKCYIRKFSLNAKESSKVEIQEPKKWDIYKTKSKMQT